MYSKIMIWANVTKFGQNFIAPPKFFGLVRVWVYLYKCKRFLFLKYLTKKNLMIKIINLRTLSIPKNYIKNWTGELLNPKILCMYVFVLKTCNLSVCLPSSLPLLL